MRYSGFIGPSYTSQSVVAADDQTVNWIPAKIESGTGTAPYVFDPAPGFSVALAGDDDPDNLTRASYQQNQACYMVQGDLLVAVKVAPDTPGRTTLVNIGGTGQASIAGNGFAGHQIMATNGIGDLFWYDTNTTASGQINTIGDIDQVAFMDGYFIALNKVESTIFVSALFDGTSWDPADVAQRSDFPDRWRRMIVRPKEIWLLGEETTSIYYDSGDADFPFQPNPSVAVARGIRALASVALLQSSPIWLADDLTVRYAQGYVPVRVSTHAVEYIWQQYSLVEDADAFTYEENGHSFYVINFPSAAASVGATWVYDLVTGLWHQRGPYNSDDDFFDISAAIYGVSTGTLTSTQGIQIVGSRLDNAVYFMSQEFSTEIDGTTGITRRRRAPHISSELKNIIYDRFQLFMEVGIAPAMGDGSDPQITLQWSNDGGQTFNTGLTISAGLHDAFNHRVIWRKLGMSRDRVFQITASDPIPWRLVDAYLEFRVGAS